MCVDVPQQIKFNYRGNTYFGAFEFPREPSHYINSICPAHTNTHTTQSTCTEYSEMQREGGGGEEEVYREKGKWKNKEFPGFTSSVSMYIHVPPLGVWLSVPISNRPGKA